MIRLVLLLFRPLEWWHERRVRRLYAKGRFRIPEGNLSAAVTTRRR